MGSNTLTSVFRRKMHTDNYLKFESHYHPRVKRGILKCRTEKVYHVTKRQFELTYLLQVFVANRYPDRLLKKILKRQPMHFYKL